MSWSDRLGNLPPRERVSGEPKSEQRWDATYDAEWQFNEKAEKKWNLAEEPRQPFRRALAMARNTASAVEASRRLRDRLVASLTLHGAWSRLTIQSSATGVSLFAAAPG